MKPLLFYLAFITLISFQQEEKGDSNDWVLINTKREVQIFTREIEGTNLKELKMLFTIEETSLDELITIFNDTHGYTNWVFKCFRAAVLEKVNERESYDYYAYDFPWPLSNRESISRSVYRQDSISKVVTLETRDANTFHKSPPLNNFVRIPEIHNRWVLTPTESGEIEFEYYLKTSPGGNIPNWAVNIVIDHGALKTIFALKDIIKSGEYKDSEVPWLMD